MNKNTYKVSYYLIFSDPLNEQEDCVVFSTRSSEASIISKRIRHILEQGKVEELSESMFKSMVEKKIVILKEEHELTSILNENKEAIGDDDILYEVIQPSAMCQLGCDYCGQDHKKININQNLSDKLVERIRAKASTGKYNSLFIGWFGGEPLMALRQIRELTPRFVAIAKEFNMGYGAKIVTNGLSLKKNIFKELAQDLHVTSMEITLDGTGEFHDERRHLKDGGKSFDIIFKNLVDICHSDDFEEMRCKISLRCNVDERNWEGVSPLIKLLAEHKLYDKIAYFYPIGVYSWGGNEAQKESLTKEKFAEQEIDWYIEMIEAGYMPGLLPQRTKQICLAVSDTSEMYDAYGNIYNCTEVSYTDFYEDTSYVLGNLKLNSKEFNSNRPLSDWNQTLMKDEFPCHSCKMLPTCGGGCPKSWHEDLRACPPPKFNIKERLALAYVLARTTDKNVFSELGDNEAPTLVAS